MAVSCSLFLGALLRVPSYHQLQEETKRRGWQRLMRWSRPIDHEVFNYTAERYRLEHWRKVLADTTKELKRNKALERCKIGGLLFLSIDANEQFKSYARCCEACRRRQVKVTDKDGVVSERTQYYHFQVYAQINGPDFHVLLDLEPVRPGEAEAEAALRLLGRIRRLYGVRFIDAITVDAWYVQGPFIKAVEKMGWGVLTVLKQQRMEVYQEAERLSRDRSPDLELEDNGREVALWEVGQLRLSDEYPGPVRVVRSHEKWTEVQEVAGKRTQVPRESNWCWVGSPRLDPYGPRVIWRAGHRRWGIENNAFNELTQHYHLEHCPHHHPRAILAGLLILILAFNLFHAFATLRSKLCGPGGLSFLALSRLLDLALQEEEPWEKILQGGRGPPRSHRS